MNLEKIATGLSNLTGRTGLLVKAKSPEILIGLGLVGGVTSAVLACRATLRVEEVLQNHKSKSDKINECWEKVKSGEIPLDDYSEQDHKRDLAVTYTQTTVDFIKLYGPAITLGAVSIACIIGGYGILRKRNIALIAAYKAIEEGFSAYRKRVIEEHGEEADYMYKNGLRKQEVVDMAYTDADGVKHAAEKRDIYVATDPNKYSAYAKFYDETCKNWSTVSEYNFMFLQAQQTYWNNVLRARGHVFLNEIYDALGISRTQAGAIVGWKIGCGDNHIDFGIFDGTKPRARAFVNGDERNILLDFNVDGVIYDVFTREKV